METDENKIKKERKRGRKQALNESRRKERSLKGRGKGERMKENGCKEGERETTER